MKKRMKHRGYPTHEQSEPDIAGMINKMQEQMFSLERKIDTLIGRPEGRPAASYRGEGRPSHKPAEIKHFPKPFQQHSPEGRSAGSYRGGSRQDNSFRERTLYKAICADCSKECEVPFRPSGDRPVYCKECFSKRKTGSPEGRPAASYKGGGSQPKERYDSRPSGEVNPPQMSHTDRPQGGDSPRGHHAASYRGGEKKKHAVKRALRKNKRPSKV